VRISYLVRGHGFGHAARDLRIIKALKNAAPHIEIDIASSGTGLEYFRSRSVPCIDMGIEDANDQSASASWKVWRHLHRAPAADMVISDEVMYAIPYCINVLDVPCAVITDWVYSDIGRPNLDRLLDGAAEILIVDFPESHSYPIGTSARISRIGPVVDEFPQAPIKQPSPKKVSTQALTVVASFGGMPSRPGARAMLDRTLRAWECYARPTDQLLILAPQPSDINNGSALSGVHWVGTSNEPEKYYRIADVVLTDGLAFTTCELIFNRIPTVAFVNQKSLKVNPRSFARRIELLENRGATRTVHEQESSEALWEAIVMASKEGYTGATALESLTWARPDDIASRLLRHVGIGP
jgi:UDP:flavonoid glycosyltransferase YjiC (YdhE family)